MQQLLLEQTVALIELQATAMEKQMTKIVAKTKESVLWVKVTVKHIVSVKMD